MVSEDGYAEILDFGLARRLPVEGASREAATMERGETSPGTVLGTISYTSPEQARGLPVDARSDVFSFGAVLDIERLLPLEE